MQWGDYLTLEYGKPVKDKDRWDGKYPVFGTNGQIGTTDLEPLCPHSTFVIGRKGAYRGVHYSKSPCSVIDTAFYVEMKSTLVDIKWAYYKFLTYNINQMDSGSAIPSTDRYEIYRIPVNIPELDEQRKAVSILSAIDEKIALNRQINDNLQQQAFALFDQLLTNANDSDCQVSEIAYLNPKRTIKKDQMARCIDMSQLSTSAAFPSGWEIKPFTGGMRFANGDTLLARITPCLENGKTAYIDFLDAEEIAFGSTEYIVLAPKDGIPPEYLYCLARYPAFVDYAVKNMNGSSGRQRVSADTIGQFVMPRPSDNALSNFGNVVSALFAQMRNNSFENIRLAAMRDALLPCLMSGEIDVSDMQI